jgi:hypothetical protein
MCKTVQLKTVQLTGIGMMFIIIISYEYSKRNEIEFGMQEFLYLLRGATAVSEFQDICARPKWKF